MPQKSQSLPTVEDLSKHPIYKAYQFGQDETVVDFGTQPLAVPDGVIDEMISRDLILRRELAERGFKIRFHAFLKGADINFFLIRGDLEIAVAGDMPAITAASKAEVVISGLAKQGFSTIVARKNWLISELRGKRIGYAPGSTAHYALMKTLSDHGVRASDVKLLPMSIDEMLNAVENGKVDAISAWEPIPMIALSRNSNFYAIQRTLNTTYYYSSRRFTQNHPEESELILAALVRAINWMRNSDQNLIQACRLTLDSAKRLSKTTTIMAPEQMAVITEKDILNITGAPLIPRNIIDNNSGIYREFLFLKATDKIPDTIRWKRIQGSFDLNTLQSIMAQPEKYKLTTYAYETEG